MPSQIALAWRLKHNPVMLPILGTSKVTHLEQNVAAADISLSDKDFTVLDAEEQKAFKSCLMMTARHWQYRGGG